MDFDVLNRIGDIVVKCVLNQDTTEFWELLQPDCALLGFQTEAGDVLELPDGAPQRKIVGALAVGRATARIFQWLTSGKDIVQPSMSCEVKRRKQQDVGQSPRGGGRVPNFDEREAADPRTFSHVNVTYGRPNFTIEDVYFVAEDGKIALVHRTITEPADPANAKWQAERKSFFHKSKPTVNAVNVRPPVLDFSFCNVTQPLDMLRIAPEAGKKHTPAPLQVIKQDNNEASNFRPAGAANNKSRQLIKAKNRYGEEEAYEFALDNEIPTAPQEDMKKDEDDQLKRLAGALAKKFHCDGVRVCNNEMTNGSQIVTVLRNLVCNYYMTIAWLDLSCNHLKTLPTGLEILPLATFYAHSNDVEDWAEVQKLAKVKTLTSVTLYGNPIATETPNYKLMALQTLTRGGLERLRSVDFVTLTRVDKELTKMYQPASKPGRSPRGTATMNLPRTPR